MRIIYFLSAFSHFHEEGRGPDYVAASRTRNPDTTVFAVRNREGMVHLCAFNAEEAKLLFEICEELGLERE